MDNFDLKECSNCVDETFTNKFGRVPQLDKLESKFSDLKGTEKALAYRKTKQLTNSKLWNFKDFWAIPGRGQTVKALKKTKGLFKDLLEDEKKAIAVLYEIFKNIEVVSIVLRFIDPENFGIISPPVRFALRQPPKKTYIEEYVDYLYTLRTYSKEYGIKRVADADMALWTLMEKCVIPGDYSCDNFKKYQEKIVEIEEENIKKKMLFQELEDEILSLAEEEIKEKEIEAQKRIQDIKKDRDRVKKELEALYYKRRIFPVDLIKLADSESLPEEKLIHDKKEQPVDKYQMTFINKLAKNQKVHKIIWSRNLNAKHPTRISHLRENGELTVLYIGPNNYAAEIKIYPTSCPDMTHARCFAILISDYVNIPNWYKKNMV